MDKKTLILQSAMEQFAERGYHHATIQDIADAAGIAKGGIYFYFKSKEELLYAVFLHYHEQLFNNISIAAERYASNPKEGLHQQIMVQFNELMSNSSVLKIFSQGQIDISEEIKKLSMTMRTKFYVCFRDQIIQVYGPDIEPHAFDLSVVLLALIREYMGFVVLDNVQFLPRDVAEYIVARLDDSVHGIVSSKKEPMLTTTIMKSIFPEVSITEGTYAVRRLYMAVDNLIRAVEGSQLEDEKRSSVQQILEVLQEEAAKSLPRPIVLQGMLALLQGTVPDDQYPQISEINKIISELI
ncbi:TetR/AcrR family transcriptional regulator [Paenibacillus sp. FJAT-26967]|uniref:TetR/AcrR family transcriptional regulator n=1 Tax=Paenibacillus sp. FJAT-26967 TaxID=1729690 RepID=UPI000838C4D8|nr:TetR/AcrR family transcriptional regulator [Paenibacillus sp. FJAT-26967]